MLFFKAIWQPFVFSSHSTFRDLSIRVFTEFVERVVWQYVHVCVVLGYMGVEDGEVSRKDAILSIHMHNILHLQFQKDTLMPHG